MSSFGQQLYDNYVRRGNTAHMPEHVVEAMRDFMIDVAGPTLEEFKDEPANAFTYAVSMIRFMHEMCSDEGLIDVCNEEADRDFDADEMRAKSEILHGTLECGIEIVTKKRDAIDVSDNLDLIGKSIGQLLSECRRLLGFAQGMVELARMQYGPNATIGTIWLNYDPPIKLI